MVILIMALQRGEMSWKDFHRSITETGRLTVMIFTMIYSILIFVGFLGFTGLPESFSSWVVGLDVPRVVIFIAILGIYFVLGMFIDGIGMLMLTLAYPAGSVSGDRQAWL